MRRRKFTEQYRQDAVELWRTSGRSAAEIARQLGIRAELLYVWGNRTRSPGAGAPAVVSVKFRTFNSGWMGAEEGFRDGV